MSARGFIHNKGGIGRGRYREGDRWHTCKDVCVCVCERERESERERERVREREEGGGEGER